MFYRLAPVTLSLCQLLVCLRRTSSTCNSTTVWPLRLWEKAKINGVLWYCFSKWKTKQTKKASVLVLFFPHLFPLKCTATVGFLVYFRNLGWCIFVKQWNHENTTVQVSKIIHLPLPLYFLGFDSTKLKQNLHPVSVKYVDLYKTQVLLKIKVEKSN